MTVETIDLSDTLRIRIEIDPDPINPRTDYECLGTIAYSDRSRHCLGDLPVGQWGMKQLEDSIERGEVIGMPVFAYIHSGVTIRAAQSNPFDCPWDSGQSGFVFVPVEKVCQEFNVSEIDDELKAKVLNLLKAEVEDFDHYLTGQCYGFVIESLTLGEDGQVQDTLELDCRWGFLGDVSYVCQEALAAAKEYEVLAAS